MNDTTGKKTPAAWSKECSRILREIHPNYQRNTKIKGRFLEFIRSDESGLLISQNFTRIRDCYYLGFALSFTRSVPFPYLYSPLVAGSRFDDGRPIGRQVFEDLGLDRHDPGYPRGIWSFGAWRCNTLDNLAKGFRLNEQYLYPHYRKVLADGKERLVSLFKAAQQLLTNVDSSLPQSDQLAQLRSNLPAEFPTWFVSAQIDATAIARGGDCYAGWGPITNTGNLDHVAPDVIVSRYLEIFFEEYGRLDEIIAIAGAL
jgi:hypothetical protein